MRTPSLFTRRRTAAVPGAAKRLLALLACGVVPAFVAQAQTVEPAYVFKMDAKSAKTVAWVTIGYTYGGWSDTGGHHSCGAWTPAESSVNWGEGFSQTRICAQGQQRSKTEQQINPVTKETRSGLVTYETRDVPASEVQPGVGSKDLIVSELGLGWSAWGAQGANYDCADWSPLPDSQPLYDNYQQSRDCSQDQLRTQQVVNVWSSGAQTPKRTDTEAQTVSVTETQPATGSKDYISGERIGAWSAWTDSGGLHSCQSWTPDVASQSGDTDFNQSRLCLQSQSGERSIFDVWRSGTETLNRTEPRTQDISGSEQRLVSATASSWSNTTTSNCSVWSPAPTTQTTSFGQSRSCDQNQSRDISYSADGQVLRTFTDTRTVQSGFADARTVTVSWTAYTDTGSPYGCGSWSPSTGSVSWGQAFTQSRNCTQATTRNRVYSSGESFAESSTRSITLTQQNTGSSDYIVNTTYGSWSGWSNIGNSYGCSSWSPSTSTYQWGQSFTQSRSCSQDQTRSRSVTYVYASGATASGGSQSDSRTTSVSDTRPATGTQDYISGSSISNWSAWSSYGSLHGCGSWSPDPSTVTWGQTFTQSRTCSQPILRTRTTTQIYASGATGSTSTETQYSDTPVTTYQQATGTKSYVTGQTTGSWSPWSYTGGPYNCGSWSPSPSTVNNGVEFTQSAQCSRNQTSTRPVYDVYSNGATVQVGTESQYQTASVTIYQTAYGTKQTVYYWISYSSSGSCTEPNAPTSLGTCSTPGATTSRSGGAVCLQGNKSYVVYYSCQ